MSLPFFPMYPSDFEAKTSHLTILEDGAYNRLLRICWMTAGCTLPADEAWILRRARAVSDEDKAAVLSVLAEFFKVVNGRYSNARLTEEFEAAKIAHERRKNAGFKGGSANALKNNTNGSSNARAMPKQPEPEPEPEPYKEPPLAPPRGGEEGEGFSSSRSRRRAGEEHPQNRAKRLALEIIRRKEAEQNG